jgi:hypothetical protein
MRGVPVLTRGVFRIPMGGWITFMTRGLPALFLCMLAVPVHAKETISGEYEVSGGFLFGAAHEYVLKDGAVISRLDWDENGAAFAGLSGKLNLFNNPVGCLTSFTVFQAKALQNRVF